MRRITAWSRYSALAQSVEHAAVNRSVVGSSPTSGAIPVIMKQRIHLFPFRTQKLSSALPKVLGGPPPGRIGSCRISFEKPVFITKTGFFLYFLAYFCAVRQICNLFCLSLNDVKIYNSAVFLWFLSELDAYTKTNRNAAFLLFVAVPEIIKFYLYLILDKFR